MSGRLHRFYCLVMSLLGDPEAEEILSNIIDYVTQDDNPNDEEQVRAILGNCLFNFICIFMRISKGEGTWGQETLPPPLKNHKSIVFLSNTSRDPRKKSQSYQASIQCWAIISPPAGQRGTPLVLIGSSLSLSAHQINIK